MNNITEKILLQGYLLINSKQISDFKQQKVYVSLSTISLNCFDEDPSNTSNHSKLISSYNVNGLKVLESSQSNQPKSFGITLTDQSYLEFICPTNSVKFQWMKQIISASTNMKSHENKDTKTNYYRESKVQNNDILELHQIYHKDKEDIIEPIKPSNSYATSKILSPVPKISYDVSILDKFSALSDSINNMQNQNRSYIHSSEIVTLVQPSGGRISSPLPTKDKETKKKSITKVVVVEQQQWIPGNYGNNRHSSKKISPVRNKLSTPTERNINNTNNNTNNTINTPRSRSAGPKIREPSYKNNYSSSSLDQWNNNDLEYNTEKQLVRPSSTIRSSHSKSATHNSQLRNDKINTHHSHSLQLSHTFNQSNNDLLSKSMDNMTLAELRAAFLTIPASIRDSLLTPSSTLDMKDSRMNSINFEYQHDLIPSLDEYSSNHNIRSNNSYNNYSNNDNSNNDNNNNELQRMEVSVEDMHDTSSMGINENYKRYRPDNIKTPVFAKGNFYYDSKSNEDSNRNNSNEKNYKVNLDDHTSYNHRSKSPSRIPIPIKLKPTSPNNNETLKYVTIPQNHNTSIDKDSGNINNTTTNNNNYSNNKYTANNNISTTTTTTTNNNNILKTNTKTDTVEINSKNKLSNSNTNDYQPALQLKNNIDNNIKGGIDKKQTLAWSQKQAWEKNIRSDYVGAGTSGGSVTFKNLPRYTSPDVAAKNNPQMMLDNISSRSNSIFTGSTRLPIGMSPPKIRANSTENNIKLSYTTNKIELTTSASLQQQQHNNNNNNNNNNNVSNTVTGQAERQRMTEWLTRIGMQRYIDNMHAHGITKLSMLELFDEDDMRLVSIDEIDIPIMLHNIRELSKRIRSVSEQVLLEEDLLVVVSSNTISTASPPSMNKNNYKTNNHADNNQISESVNNNRSNNDNNINVAKEDIFKSDKKILPTSNTIDNSINSPNKTVLEKKTNIVLSSKHNKLKDILSANRIKYKKEKINSINNLELFSIESKIKDEYEHIYTSYDEIISELLRCFDIGAGKLFFHAWKQALLYLPDDSIKLNDKKPAIFNARQVIEFHLYLHFAIYSIANELGKRIQHESIDMLKQYLENIKISLDLASNEINYAIIDKDNETKLFNPSLESIDTSNQITPNKITPTEAFTTRDEYNNGHFSALSSPSKTQYQDVSFLNSREYATYAGIVLVPDPRQNIAFQPLFKKEWSIALRKRLIQFLDFADSSYYRNTSLSNNNNNQNNLNNNMTNIKLMDENMVERLECKTISVTNDLFIPIVKSSSSPVQQSAFMNNNNNTNTNNNNDNEIINNNDVTNIIVNNSDIDISNINDRTNHSVEVNNLDILNYIETRNETNNFANNTNVEINIDNNIADSNVITYMDIPNNIDIENKNNIVEDNSIANNINIINNANVEINIGNDNVNNNITVNNETPNSNNIELISDVISNNINITNKDTDIICNVDFNIDNDNINNSINIEDVCISNNNNNNNDVNRNNIINNDIIDNSSQTTTTRRKVKKYIQHVTEQTLPTTSTTTNNTNIPIILDDYNMLSTISPLKLLNDDIIEDEVVVSPTESVLSQLTVDSTKPLDNNNNTINDNSNRNGKDLTTLPLKLSKFLQDNNNNSSSSTKKQYNLLSKNTMQSQVHKYNKLLKQNKIN